VHTTLPSGTPAYVARPPGDPAAGGSRGLVVIPDIGGLRPLFEQMASRLAAEQGWVVCVFELWPGREHLSSLQERLDAAGSLEDARVLGDARAAAEVTGCEQVGVVGFCIGGMYALKASATQRFGRAVSFYGMARVPEAWRSPTQSEPLDAVGSPGRCPVLVVAGTEDPWLPADDLDALEAVGAEVVRYPGADHGFVHDPDRPAHRPDDAADAWRRAVAHLGG
jgi:carboxymethylenebutenolidase